MKEIIEHGENGAGQVVGAGDSNSTVSFKVYQDIYHQITGRTEQVRKRYSDDLLLEFRELEQLHHKIMQLCDVHNVVAKNETISVIHDKERKEQFTSFERFRAYNTNATSPCVNVVFKYNFSIIPAGLQKPQEYIVTVKLTSRVTLIQQVEEDAPPFVRGRWINFMGDNTAEITVDYADYVVARGFIEAFDEWLRGCKRTPKSRWLGVLRRWSRAIPNIFRLALVVIIAWYALRAVPVFFKDGATPEAWARFLILYSSSTFILLSLVSAAGKMIENAIHAYPALSYLKLNKGDERLIEDFKGRRDYAVLKFISGAVLTVILGVLSAKIEKIL